METTTSVAIRAIKKSDAAAIAAIDARHSGTLKRKWWDEVVARHTRAAKDRVALVAVEGARERVVGYVLAQIRAFEFGSEPCGWVFAIGVHPDRLRSSIATLLFAHVRQRLAELGVTLIRTMVRRDDVPVLTFFRGRGFVAGPYVELELKLNEGASP